MLSRWVRSWDSRLLRPLLVVLARAKLTPNMLTIGSLICAIVAGIVITSGHLLAAGTLLLLGGIADGLDGELARQTSMITPFGAFLDSICDHCGDFAFSLGLLQLYLSERAQTEVFLIVVALFGSLVGSQIRSRAGMVGIQTKDIGLVTRFERILILAAGIFTAHLPIALWLLAILTNIAALQRMAHVVKCASELPAA